MKVGWLVDPCVYMGGAEMSAAEFKEAAPEGVEVVDCPPEIAGGGVVEGLDAYVIHNCLSYAPQELTHRPAFKMWHDVGPYVTKDARQALEGATEICVSPLQAKAMNLDVVSIPPAVPLDAFRKAAESAQERSGAVCVGRWMGPGKAPEAAAEWAKGNGGIDFYGEGPVAPPGSVSIPYEDLPAVVARYKTFVHLPRDLEPFGRAVVEAWAAGCAIVVNSLVGARWWITEAPEKLDTAAEDFWDLVCGT